MIHPYKEEELDLTMDTLGEMFELAVMHTHRDIDLFANVFACSYIATAFEKADYIYVYGKSSNELLALLYEEELKEYKENSFASPSYWVGYVLAYNQWYYNCHFSDLLRAVPASKLLNYYSLYHEMDISKTTEIFVQAKEQRMKLKYLRLKKHYSQRDLSLISDVPLRNIKAYERGQIDIAKASGETLYRLAKALDCAIEEIII